MELIAHLLNLFDRAGDTVWGLLLAEHSRIHQPRHVRLLNASCKGLGPFVLGLQIKNLAPEFRTYLAPDRVRFPFIQNPSLSHGG